MSCGRLELLDREPGSDLAMKRMKRMKRMNYFGRVLICLLLVGAGHRIAVAEDKEEGVLLPGKGYIEKQGGVQYWVHLPVGYQASEKRWPLILFLHGGGESGTDLEQVKKHGIPREIEQGRQLPAIVLAPQNADPSQLWDDVLLASFLEAQLEVLRVDDSRIYLTGLSRGGYGAVRLAVQNPRRFAAVAVMAGGGAVTYMPWCKETPFWFFHGEADRGVPLSESRRLVDALRELGAEVKWTSYPGVGHDCWTQAFSDDRLYDWLFSHRLRD